MRYFLIVVWISCLTLAVHSSAGASEEFFAVWRKADITARLPAPFEQVRVVAEIEGEGSALSLKQFQIFNGKRELRLPKAALDVIKNPNLETLLVSAEGGYGKHPWLYVSLTLGPPEEGGEWDFPRVYFAFQNNKFVKRFVARARADGARDFSDEWVPTVEQGAAATDKRH